MRHRKKDATTKYTKGTKVGKSLFVWFVFFVVKNDRLPPRLKDFTLKDFAYAAVQ
jgi:hypothetical protein